MGNKESKNSETYLYVEKYNDISKEPLATMVLAQSNLNELRNTPPKIKDGIPYYKSLEHQIIHNDKEKKLIRVYKSYNEYYCPICKQETIPQVLLKLIEDDNEIIIRNGAYHLHRRQNIEIPCLCKNKHLVKLIYSNRCECGWPYK